MTNFGHAAGSLHEKMINNISEPLSIILEQIYSLHVTNNSDFEEGDLNSPETLKFETRIGIPSWGINKQFFTTVRNNYLTKLCGVLSSN